MKLKSKHGILTAILSWEDIDLLKQGNEIGERYNGEHKFNLSCTAESLFHDNWLETENFPFATDFNAYLHDFFVKVPIFDIRNAFVRSTTVPLRKNPFYEKVVLQFP